MTIKTHHNVGGLKPGMQFTLIEPLRELFKDEVRNVGRELGLPGGDGRAASVPRARARHPRARRGERARRSTCCGRPTRSTSRRFASANLYDEIWQAFAVLLPVRSVGVMGDERTYDNVVALRAVTSTDGMTADWFPFPHDVHGAHLEPDHPRGATA